MSKKMPPQRPGKSEGDVATPPDLMSAVTTRFGEPAWDLAATAANAKARRFLTKEDDALTRHWHRLRPSGWLWLNPPYSDPACPIWMWAEACRDEMALGARILFLVPFSVGTWFQTYVEPHAHVIGLHPRPKFVGHENQYPKDLMLAVFAYGLTGFSTWRWKG